MEVICTLLSSMKSPTILPLAEEGWSSLHSVVEEVIFKAWARAIKEVIQQDKKQLNIPSTKGIL